jgi:hypothetical protein
MRNSFVFTRNDMKKLGKALGCVPAGDASFARFEVGGAERKLALEIHPEIRIGKKTGSLVSVYTRDAHLQLHFCSGYVVSKAMGEVTFIGENGGRLSGLIIEQGGGCSLYANVDRSLLSGDFTQLGPEVMLSGVALSMTDTLLEDSGRRDRNRRKPSRRSR